MLRRKITIYKGALKCKRLAPAALEQGSAPPALFARERCHGNQLQQIHKFAASLQPQSSDQFGKDGATFRKWLLTTYVQITDHLQTDETLSLLTRLSQKPGVQSTLILSRDTGAIVRTSGLISKSSSANPNSTLPASTQETLVDEYPNGRKESGMNSAEDVASAVWKFIGAAGILIDELDKEDDIRLLRLRTKKNELVIVPGMSYLKRVTCLY